MRLVFPLALLALLLPLAGAATQPDPVGDQATYVAGAYTFAPGLCQDDATDVVALGAATNGTTFEVRLTVVDLAATLVSCSGRDVTDLGVDRAYSVFGRLNVPGGLNLFSDGATGSGFACALDASTGVCTNAPATFHVDGNALVWSIPVTGSGPAGCNCTWNFAGVNALLTGSAHTYVGPAPPFTTPLVELRDATAWLNATM